jgi:hypothetical protein
MMRRHTGIEDAAADGPIRLVVGGLAPGGSAGALRGGGTLSVVSFPHPLHVQRWHRLRALVSLRWPASVSAAASIRYNANHSHLNSQHLHGHLRLQRRQ